MRSLTFSRHVSVLGLSALVAPARAPVVALVAVLWLLACAPPTGASRAAPPTAAPAAPGVGPAETGALTAPGAATRGVEDFYRGKTIRVIVGSAAGGGFDTYARTIARYFGRFVPGTPNVIVENMPGAGSLVAANHVSRTAPKDGTVVAHTEGGLVLQQMFGLNGVEFDARRWQVLGVPAADTNLCVATRASGIRSIAEVMNPGGKPLVIGSYAPGSALWDVPMRLRAALDLNLRLVEGYDGTAKIRLAMDQGEVDGICGWSWESVKATALDRVESGDWTVIVQGTERAAAELATVPVALDLARDEPARQLIRLGIVVPNQILRIFFVAPEVPPERANALRQAFAQTLDDPEFRQDAARSKLDLAPISGEEAQRLIGELLTMPEGLKTRLRQINNKEDY